MTDAPGTREWQYGDCVCGEPTGECECPVHAPLDYLETWWRHARGAARFTSPERAEIDSALKHLRNAINARPLAPCETTLLGWVVVQRGPKRGEGHLPLKIASPVFATKEAGQREMDYVAQRTTDLGMSLGEYSYTVEPVGGAPHVSGRGGEMASWTLGELLGRFYERGAAFGRGDIAYDDARANAIRAEIERRATPSRAPDAREDDRETEAEIIRGLYNLIQWEVGHGNMTVRDHACPKCVSVGDLVDPNFLCAYHRARAYLDGDLAASRASVDGEERIGPPDRRAVGRILGVWDDRRRHEADRTFREDPGAR